MIEEREREREREREKFTVNFIVKADERIPH